MATYKVIQDIEAEDKLLGPLSLRQFIYAVIVVALGFVMFTLGKANPLLAIPFLPPAILFGFLAAPFGHDQSSEVWLLAKIRFILKPRTRVWNQAGLQELVTITAPKKVERVLTNGLDQYQVQSRLQALARTIDTRGWAVKGVDTNMFVNQFAQDNQSDRLVSTDNFATPVPDYDVTAQDDILDADTSQVAQQVDQLIEASTTAHRQAIMDRMAQVAAPQPQAAPQQFVAAPYDPVPAPATQAVPQAAPIYAQPPAMTAPVAPVYVDPPISVSPVSQPMPINTGITAADEAALLNQVHEQSERQASAYKHMHTLQQSGSTTDMPVQNDTTTMRDPAASPTQETQPDNSATASVTQTPDAGILKLAGNDDLTVATIARQVHKNDPPANTEVVISLH